MEYFIEQTKVVTNKATEIMKTGATGSYTKEFDTMDTKLNKITQLLKNTTSSSHQLQELDNLIAKKK